MYRVVDVRNHKTESMDNDFNSLRHSGDVEFSNAGLWESIHCGNVYCCDYFYNRPKDFKVARDWVKKNIVEGNQIRLLDALDKMEKDPQVYLYFGW